MKRCVILLLFLLLVPFVFAYGVTFYNPAWNPQDGIVYEEVLANDSYELVVKTLDIAITKIIFYVEEDFKNAGITVYHLKSFPDHLPETPENTTYEVNEIKYRGFVPHQTVNFVYYFEVNKTWLEENSVSRNSVQLHYYDSPTESWIPLKTDIKGDDDGFVFYKAEYEGVHYLYIGSSQPVMPVEDVVEEAEEVGEEGVVETSEDGSALTEVVPVDLTKQPVVAPEPSEPVTEELISEGERQSKTIGVLVIVAILIIILIIIFSRRRKSPVDREIHSYVKTSLKHGKSKDEVREKLLEVGWHDERVDRVLAKHKERQKEKVEHHAVHHGPVFMAEEKNEEHIERKTHYFEHHRQPSVAHHPDHSTSVHVAQAKKPAKKKTTKPSASKTT
ncbi:MAG: PGF-pre-PGF domain-containing protein, partial [Candidatus Aenigmarchaeota archaeon]|nr:PGF-pre-PGF domain-containing protein [Candidatus Aenigmarchaeota archaeon]